MKKDLQIFNFNNNKVRTIIIDNTIWFCLSDVCKILYLVNPTEVAKTLEIDSLSNIEGPEIGIRTGKVNIINESALYQVIFQSRKPEAKKFTKWITSEVIPQIRKTGNYISKELTRLELIDMARDSELGRLKEIKKNKLLEKENKEQYLLIEEQQPKVDSYKTLMDSKEMFTIGRFANITGSEFGLGQNKMFKLLRELEILMDNEIRWNTPYQKYLDKGYFEVIEKETRVDKDDLSVFSSVTLITSNGIDYLIKKLRKHFSDKK